VPRITYLEGLIELMSPSQYHEIDKLEVYRKLGVREVWYYERGTLRFFALRGERGREGYAEVSRSEFLPQLPLPLILAGMQDSTQSQTAAVRALRQALRAPAN
jgi:Uma2 family endonuclease